MAPAHKVAPVVAKVTIYEKSTGNAIQRWPVDARAMLRTGEFVLTAPGAEADAKPPEWAKGVPASAAVVAESIVDPKGADTSAVIDVPAKTEEKAAESAPAETPAKKPRGG